MVYGLKRQIVAWFWLNYKKRMSRYLLVWFIVSEFLKWNVPSSFLVICLDKMQFNTEKDGFVYIFYIFYNNPKDAHTSSYRYNAAAANSSMIE